MFRMRNAVSRNKTTVRTHTAGPSTARLRHTETAPVMRQYHSDSGREDARNTIRRTMFKPQDLAVTGIVNQLPGAPANEPIPSRMNEQQLALALAGLRDNLGSLAEGYATETGRKFMFLREVVHAVAAPLGLRPPEIEMATATVRNKTVEFSEGRLSISQESVQSCHDPAQFALFVRAVVEWGLIYAMFGDQAASLGWQHLSDSQHRQLNTCMIELDLLSLPPVSSD
ncbi:hypothetical protein [Lacisediminimonas profundi]|uniref:hypothetical protein n=1 Tax=Lacisediminimonas profundi TaxID=2603856 RepID=UPI00124B2AB9|nr:hypothetical protein [Lacisediminimonas profundi]